MDIQDIGERVYWLRDERGWTQEDLARAAGVSPTTVSHIESGAIERPRMNTIRRLARAFGTSSDELSSPKVAPPSAQPSKEAGGGGETLLKQRIDRLQRYKTWLQDVAEKLGRELHELQETRDSEPLLTLLVNAMWTAEGAYKQIEEDPDIEAPEDEELEELKARREMWEAYGKLTDLLDDIDRVIADVEGKSGDPLSNVTRIRDHMRKKAV